ncbi:MAG: hypothetical protein ACYC56_02670 [Candidatus Aquicultor sp.]
MNIAIVLLIVDWLIFNYVFKYQRVTLLLSREHTGASNPEYQMLLTPNWVGIMGWLTRLLHLGTAVAFFVVYGWLFAILYLLLSFFGYGLIDALIPFPSTRYYFKLIKNSISNDINNAKNPGHKVELEKILQAVKQAAYALEQSGGGA